MLPGYRNQDNATGYELATATDELLEKCVAKKGKGGIYSKFSTCNLCTVEAAGSSVLRRVLPKQVQMYMAMTTSINEFNQAQINSSKS